MARSIVSFGMLAPFAAATAVRRRGLEFRSLPPMRAAMVRSLMSLVKAFPRRASFSAFLCLIVLHLEWPDMALSSWQGNLCDRAIIFPGRSKRGRLRTIGNYSRVE